VHAREKEKWIEKHGVCRLTAPWRQSMRDARDSTGERPRVYANVAHPYTLLIFRPPEITRRRGGTVQESTCVLYGAGALQSMYARLGVDENNNCVIDRSYVNARRLPESCTAVCKYRKCTILFKALSALPLDFRVTLHERGAYPPPPSLSLTCLSLFRDTNSIRPNSREIRFNEGYLS